MTRMIKFTKIRYFMFLFSALVIAGGIIGTVGNNGFNLGIDYQAGLNQRVQVAPVAFTASFSGVGDASFDMQSSSAKVEVRSDKGVTNFTYQFADYPTLADLEAAMSEIPGFSIELIASGASSSTDLTSGLSYPLSITADTSYINIVGNDSSSVSIDKVRSSLSGLGNPQVQVVGNEDLSEFMVRVSDPEGSKKDEIEIAIVNYLEKAFGANTVVIKQSDYVGPRFSSSLASQSVSLTLAALALILLYIWFRFKLGFAVSAISALAHDVLIMLGFIGTFGLEVSTTTIAAVLTIIGYSLNDTIVVFDRIRENQTLLKGEKFETIVNTSITQSLSRTIITSLTTLLAVVALYVFGTGSIKDFALNLIVGIFVGTYSSVFIASPVLLGWTNTAQRRKAKKRGVSSKANIIKEGALAEETVALKKITEIPEIERKRKGKRKNK
ncbi:MAG: protein translocase subunit SecF [Spirochaetia bacterium]|jgi:preprotein translocase subunit SecF|nr:protein translocase subunit SecF [Spirochaetia bacterium]